MSVLLEISDVFILALLFLLLSDRFLQLLPTFLLIFFSCLLSCFYFQEVILFSFPFYYGCISFFEDIDGEFSLRSSHEVFLGEGGLVWF